MKKRSKKKRGFPIAILVGFDEQFIYIWKLFSESIKKYSTLKLTRKWKNADTKDIYRFYENLLDELRGVMDVGLKSIILVSPLGTDWAVEFFQHVQKHHRWLINSKTYNQASFGITNGNARTYKDLHYLMSQKETKEVIKKTTAEEAYLLIKQLEKSINKNNSNISILYGLEQVENRIYEGGKKDLSVAKELDYLLLTDEFLENNPKKGRVYRLKQIAKNKGIITKVIREDSPAGSRIRQFGGIIAFKNVI